MNSNSKIFIAGAAGMVGSAIIRKLLSQGHTHLIGSYHNRLPDPGKFLLNDPAEGIPPGLQLVQIDLRRQEDVDAFFKAEAPDYVFIAAARVGGIHANNTFPAQFIYDNLTIQNNIIHAAYTSGVQRLLFLGSTCIYPQQAPQPMKEEHLLTGLLEPTNAPYAIAKIAGIKMCEAYNRQYDTRFIALMPTNLYGPHDNFDLESSHALPAMIRKFHLAKLAENQDWEGIQKDEATFGPIPKNHSAACGAAEKDAGQRIEDSILLWGTGTPKREFLHVDDLADAGLFIMQLDERTLGNELLSYPKPCFVNAGTGIDCTIKELALLIRNVVGFQGDVQFDPTKPDGTPRKLTDVSRLAGLGWTAAIGLEQGIRQTYAWYQTFRRHRTDGSS
ncbi:MAG: GDP-L-fucose synthase [Desulfatitalea sp.]|nr:GDP-L-fucose synthase [Desulfatitalea sp.]NNJ99227.1 GDP-L-fucose synthase [Desulfatitalea sp.]